MSDPVGQVADEAYLTGLRDGDRDGVARVTAAVEAAIRLVTPDHLTPIGERVFRAALSGSREKP